MSVSEKLPSGVTYLPQDFIVPEIKGQLLTSNGITTDLLNIGVNNQVLIADDNEAEGLKWVDSLSVIGTTLKADIVTSNGTNPTIFSGNPINDQVLVADDSETEGLKWINPVTKTWTFYHATNGTNVPSVGGASWQTRPINIIQATNTNTTTITLASNRLTIIEIGKYNINSSQCYHAVQELQLRLRNITNNTTYIGSTITEYADNTTANPTIFCTIDIISVPTIIEFQYNCEISLGDGLGRTPLLLVGSESQNIYASFSLTKIT